MYIYLLGYFHTLPSGCRLNAGNRDLSFISMPRYEPDFPFLIINSFFQSTKGLL